MSTLLDAVRAALPAASFSALLDRIATTHPSASPGEIDQAARALHAEQGEPGRYRYEVVVQAGEVKKQGQLELWSGGGAE